MGGEAPPGGGRSVRGVRELKALDLAKAIASKYGSHTARIATKAEGVERLPTGIFPVDLALGGGFPRNQISVVYGPESSGKTNLVLATIAREQKVNKGQACVLIDAEYSFDPTWAPMFGIDLDRLIYIKPITGEQAVDFTIRFLGASDVSIVAVDSVAAMTPKAELEGDVDRVQVAGNAILIQRLVKKAVVSMTNGRDEGRYPTLLLVNQRRYQVGKMFGDPEKQPGGSALMHHAHVILRLYGKPETKEHVSASVPAVRLTQGVVKKCKARHVAEALEYRMAMIPHDGLKVGEVDDWNTLKAYLRDLGWLKKTKGGFQLLDQEFPLLKDVREFLKSDLKTEAALKRKVIEHELVRIYESEHGSEELQAE